MEKIVKREIAERLAATKVEHVTVADVQKIISEFLNQLARCPVCDGTGTHTFGRNMTVKLQDRIRPYAEGSESFVLAGTVGSCPRCGSDDLVANGQGDPDYVAWHCLLGRADETCQSDKKSQEKDRRDDHAQCGYRIVLPYDGVKKADS